MCLHDPSAEDTQERRRGYKAKMKHWFGGAWQLGEGVGLGLSPLSSPAAHRARPELRLARSVSGQSAVGADQVPSLVRKAGVRMVASSVAMEHAASGMGQSLYLSSEHDPEENQTSK